jgi:hypothetical protein
MKEYEIGNEKWAMKSRNGVQDGIDGIWHLRIMAMNEARESMPSRDISRSCSERLLEE